MPAGVIPTFASDSMARRAGRTFLFGFLVLGFIGFRRKRAQIPGFRKRVSPRSKGNGKDQRPKTKTKTKTKIKTKTRTRTTTKPTKTKPTKTKPTKTNQLRLPPPSASRQSPRPACASRNFKSRKAVAVFPRGERFEGEQSPRGESIRTRGGSAESRPAVLASTARGSSNSSPPELPAVRFGAGGTRRISSLFILHPR